MKVRAAARDRARGALTLIVLALLAPAACADDEIAALRGQLEQIKSLVQGFDARLRALEAARAQSPLIPRPTAPDASTSGLVAQGTPRPVTSTAHLAPTIDASTPVVPRLAWHRIHAGLTESDVQALIGPPTKVFELAGKTVWYYYYPSVGAGSVFFGSRGVASSVQRPSGGG
ncbi:MAG: hypothetical protein WCE48_04715 [Steroidobacteraceae bacterium]